MRRSVKLGAMTKQVSAQMPLKDHERLRAIAESRKITLDELVKNCLMPLLSKRVEPARE